MKTQVVTFSEATKLDEDAVHKYVRGYLSSDSTLVKEAFFEDDKLCSADQGELEVVELSKFIKLMDERKARNETRKSEVIISTLDNTESTASVRTKLYFEKFLFTDFLSLVKIKTQWKIVNKVYSTEIR